MDKLGTYDVIVIGAGHAGIEAAHAAARLGARTAVFTLSLDFIGNMPCNPSIGGTAKGHLVREVDALGGLMGLAADATYLQSRMLNRGKGPAVHSLRVQTDRKRYHIWMKHALEQTANLDIHQGEIVGVDVQDGKVTRNAQIRVIRDGVVIFVDKISSLKRFKDDAKEVAQGFECGIGLERFNDIKEGDILEAFIMEEVKPA